MAARANIMAHLMYPARGLGRPGLQQVLSDASLRDEFLRHEEVSKAPLPAPSAAETGRSRSVPALTTAPAEPGGLSDILQELDRAVAARNRQRALDRQSDRLREQSRSEALRLKRSQSGPGLGEDRQPWTYCDPPGLLSAPPIERDTSLTHTKNPHLQGIYDTPGWKPPHWEKDTFGGWTASTRMENTGGFFGTKTKDRMAPKELMYSERLERKIQQQVELMHQDALARTVGKLRKEALAATAPAFSANNRTAKPWAEPKTSAGCGFFSTPEPYKPGEQHFDEYLNTAIMQPTRTSSHKRNFIASKDHLQTSHWRAPQSGHKHGTSRALEVSDGLLLPPGVRRLREEEKRRRRAERARARSAGS